MPEMKQPQGPQNPADGEGSEPQYVSKDEFLKLQEQANNQSAILRKEREASAKVQKEMSERMEALAARLEQPRTEPEPEAGKGKSNIEKALEVAQAKFDARVKELEIRAAKAETEKADTEARQRASEERQALSSGLSNLGVEGPRQKLALAYLVNEEKRIARADDGSIGFRVKRGTGANAYEEIISLDEGLKEWSTTEEGKSVMPPRGAAGSGTTPSKPGRGDGKMTQADAARLLAIHLSRG